QERAQATLRVELHRRRARGLRRRIVGRHPPGEAAAGVDRLLRLAVPELEEARTLRGRGAPAVEARAPVGERTRAELGVAVVPDPVSALEADAIQHRACFVGQDL